ncbi:MAG: Chaperone SurA [Burkholderia sp.]|jgi:peptidyl-prolyl cis-trans isomerase SurA
MNKFKTISVLCAALMLGTTAWAAQQQKAAPKAAAAAVPATAAAAAPDKAAAAPAAPETAAAASGDLDRIVAVVNRDVITERELEQRTHTVALNLRRQNINLPPMEQLRAQVLERLITERTILQRASETGIRVDDQMVNAAVEQIARQNNITVDELRQKLLADGVTFSAFKQEIHDEIVSQRLREREVDSKIRIPDSEIDAYLADQAGVTNETGDQFHIRHIFLPVDHPDNDPIMKKLADDIAAKARAGQDFGTLAATYSRAEDALQGGDLGWHDLRTLVPALRSGIGDNPQAGAIYVFRADNAWHIIQLAEKRSGAKQGVAAAGAAAPVQQTHVRHILIPVNDLTPEPEALRRIGEIRDRIVSGKSDFATMARLHSVDSSATRGGDLGWVQAGDTVPDFERAMNSLKEGEVSQPVKTQYGYHLIKVDERRVDKSGNPKRIRLAAMQALRAKKLDEAVYNWQRELRDSAYVEIRNQDDQ